MDLPKRYDFKESEEKINFIDDGSGHNYNIADNGVWNFEDVNSNGICDYTCDDLNWD